MRRIFRAVLAVAAIGLLGGCDGGNRVVGFIVNGQTGERINIFAGEGKPANQTDDSDAKAQVYAVIEGRFTRAEPCKAGDATEENDIQPDGCYQIRSVPFNQQIPIFANIPEFERFHGTIGAIGDGEYNHDTQIVANLRVFPKNFKIDYRVFVHQNGTPVPDAHVMCQIRQGSNALRTDGNFLAPENTTSAALGGKTDGEGIVNLAGAQLVNGATYNCEAFRAEAFGGQAVSGEGTFIAGVSQPDLNISVSQNAPGGGPATDVLYAIRSNADDPSDLLGDGASLTIFFNRPVELVPRTQDCHEATVQSNDYDRDGRPLPSTRPSEFGNGASESVTATPSGDGLSLSLSYRLQNPVDTDDIGTFVTFAGIYVRPTGSPNDASVVRRIGGGTGCAEGGALQAQPLRSSRTGTTQGATIRLF